MVHNGCANASLCPAGCQRKKRSRSADGGTAYTAVECARPRDSSAFSRGKESRVPGAGAAQCAVSDGREHALDLCAQDPGVLLACNLLRMPQVRARESGAIA